MDILISGWQDVNIKNRVYDGLINNHGYKIEDDSAIKATTSSIRREIADKGLYEYCKGKQFVEEYAYLLSEKEHSQERIIERILKIVIRYVEYE